MKNEQLFLVNSFDLAMMHPDMALSCLKVRLRKAKGCSVVMQRLNTRSFFCLYLRSLNA